MNLTRTVAVLADFIDENGSQHKRGEVFEAAYVNERQRRSVNERIHRGFLTFDIESAKSYLEESPKARKGR